MHLDLQTLQILNKGLHEHFVLVASMPPADVMLQVAWQMPLLYQDPEHHSELHLSMCNTSSKSRLYGYMPSGWLVHVPNSSSKHSLMLEMNSS